MLLLSLLKEWFYLNVCVSEFVVSSKVLRRSVDWTEGKNVLHYDRLTSDQLIFINSINLSCLFACWLLSSVVFGTSWPVLVACILHSVDLAKVAVVGIGIEQALLLTAECFFATRFWSFWSYGLIERDTSNRWFTATFTHRGATILSRAALSRGRNPAFIFKFCIRLAHFNDSFRGSCL